MANSRSSREEAAAKRRRALALHNGGATYEEVAEKVGYANRSAAYNAVKKARGEAELESSEEELSRELSRLDMMARSLWPKVVKGDTKAVTALLAVQKQRVGLLGFDGSMSESVKESLGEAGCRAVMAVIHRVAEDDDMGMTDEQKTKIKSVAVRHIQSVASGRK